MKFVQFGNRLFGVDHIIGLSLRENTVLVLVKGSVGSPVAYAADRAAALETLHSLAQKLMDHGVQVKFCWDAYYRLDALSAVELLDLDGKTGVVYLVTPWGSYSHRGPREDMEKLFADFILTLDRTVLS